MKSGPASYSCLMHSYFLYSALLVLKLLAFSPLAALMCHPDKVQRANINDLKNLTPFWLVAALYMTTCPDEDTAVYLLRTYAIARLIIVYGYVQRIPKIVNDIAFYISLMITGYMGGSVVYTYREAI